jgi:hypothetical protein
MSASFKSLHESINRIASHLESERGTRARADDRLEQIWIGEVRSLRHSLIKYGRRNSDPPESCPPT